VVKGDVAFQCSMRRPTSWLISHGMCAGLALKDQAMVQRKEPIVRAELRLPSNDP